MPWSLLATCWTSKACSKDLGNTISNLTIDKRRPGCRALRQRLLLGRGPRSRPVGGSVTSSSSLSNVGALAGDSEGTISNVYATGAVIASAESYAGGLVGWNGAYGGTISNAYATGAGDWRCQYSNRRSGRRQLRGRSPTPMRLARWTGALGTSVGGLVGITKARSVTPTRPVRWLPPQGIMPADWLGITKARSVMPIGTSRPAE